MACNVGNIENDIVKVEYERLKHNHHQERSLRSVFFVSTCVHRNAHTLSQSKGKLLREPSVRSCTQRGSHGLIGLIEQDTVCIQPPIMSPQYCTFSLMQFACMSVDVHMCNCSDWLCVTLPFCECTCLFCSFFFFVWEAPLLLWA